MRSLWSEARWYKHPLGSFWLSGMFEQPVDGIHAFLVRMKNWERTDLLQEREWGTSQTGNHTYQANWQCVIFCNPRMGGKGAKLGEERLCIASCEAVFVTNSIASDVSVRYRSRQAMMPPYSTSCSRCRCDRLPRLLRIILSWWRTE